MTRNPVLRTGAFIALLSLPSLSAAQTAEETLPLGQPVDGVGTTYIAEEHGDWEIRCIRAAEGEPEPCQMYQLLLDEQDNPVAEFNVFDLPDEGQIVAGATIVTPLDTLLQPGVRLRVDDGPVWEYPFAFCQPVGCFARLGLTAENVQAFRAGGETTVIIVPLPAPDQVVSVTASLSGFTAGYAALAERNAVAVELFQSRESE